MKRILIFLLFINLTQINAQLFDINKSLEGDFFLTLNGKEYCLKDDENFASHLPKSFGNILILKPNFYHNKGNKIMVQVLLKSNFLKFNGKPYLVDTKNNFTQLGEIKYINENYIIIEFPFIDIKLSRNAYVIFKLNENFSIDEIDIDHYIKLNYKPYSGKNYVFYNKVLDYKLKKIPEVNILNTFKIGEFLNKNPDYKKSDKKFVFESVISLNLNSTSNFELNTMYLNNSLNKAIKNIYLVGIDTINFKVNEIKLSEFIFFDQLNGTIRFRGSAPITFSSNLFNSAFLLKVEMYFDYHKDIFGGDNSFVYLKESDLVFMLNHFYNFNKSTISRTILNKRIDESLFVKDAPVDKLESISTGNREEVGLEDNKEIEQEVEEDESQDTLESISTGNREEVGLEDNKEIEQEVAEDESQDTLESISTGNREEVGLEDNEEIEQEVEGDNFNYILEESNTEVREEARFDERGNESHLISQPKINVKIETSSNKEENSNFRSSKTEDDDIYFVNIDNEKSLKNSSIKDSKTTNTINKNFQFVIYENNEFLSVNPISATIKEKLNNFLPKLRATEACLIIKGIESTVYASSDEVVFKYEAPFGYDLNNIKRTGLYATDLSPNGNKYFLSGIKGSDINSSIVESRISIKPKQFKLYGDFYIIIKTLKEELDFIRYTTNSYLDNTNLIVENINTDILRKSSLDNTNNNQKYQFNPINFDVPYSLLYKDEMIKDWLSFSTLEKIRLNEIFISNESYVFFFKGGIKEGKEVLIPNSIVNYFTDIPIIGMYVTDFVDVFTLGGIKPYFKNGLKAYSATAGVQSIYQFSGLDEEFYIAIAISKDVYSYYFGSENTIADRHSNEILNYSGKGSGADNSKFSVSKNTPNTKKNEEYSSEWEEINVNTLGEIKSIFTDDDYDIKDINKKNEGNSRNKWAIVISNKTYEDEGISDVDFAYNDGIAIINYLTKSLGYIENNIVWVKDATKTKFEELFGNERIQNGLLSSLVSEEDEFLIYYSGHGSPGGPQDSEPYLVPVDCSSNFVSISGFPLEVFYRNINQIKAKKKTIILDACFSGKDVIKNVSSVGIKVKSQPFIEDPNTFIFTSSKSEEVSNWFVEKENSLFTYYFLKSINEFSKTDFNKDGELSYQEIYNSLMDKSFGLPYATRRLNQPIQTPQLLTAGNPSTSFF